MAAYNTLLPSTVMAVVIETGMVAVALRQQITRANVEKKSRKDGQDNPERWRDAEETGAEDADAGSDCIGQKPTKRRSAATPVSQHDIHGVQPIGKVMRQHRDGDDQAHGGRGLKCEANTHSVQQAVQR